MFRTALRILIYWCLVLLAFVLLREIPITSADNILKSVAFCEILPNPDGSDTKDNEYFKLANLSSNSVSLAGWKVCNISNDCYTLEETVPSDSCLKIPRTAFVFTLHNDKEELTLYDQDANSVDKIITGTAPSGKAWQCLDSSCAWGTPQESCDYSFLLPPNDLPENDNINTNDNSSETNQNSNGSSLTNGKEQNSNNNFPDEASGVSSYVINETKDFSRIRKILRKKKLVSVLVNLKGIVALPQGLMAKTYFYLSFKDQLIKTHIYSSCQNAPNCLRDIDIEQGEKLIIQTATLKLIDGRFELFLDKNTQITDEGNKKLKKKEIKPDFNKQVGKVVHIGGTIVAKKGDYFFVDDGKNIKTASVYIPKSLQNAFAKKLDSVPLGYFPFYLASTPSKSWLGGAIDASGIVEAVGQEYRIIAYELNNLRPADIRPATEKSDEKNEKEPKKSEIEKPKDAPPKNEEAKEEKTEANKPNKEQLKTILAQNLSWQSLWSIMINKLAIRVNALRQYF